MYTLATDSRKAADAQTGHAHLKSPVVRRIRGNQARQFSRICFARARPVGGSPQRHHLAVGFHAFENTSFAIMMARLVSGQRRRRLTLHKASSSSIALPRPT